MAILEVENLSIAFDEKYGLKDVTLSVSEGEFFIVFGGTGCGKSLFFRAIAGLQQPTFGRVRLFGKDMYALSGREWARVQRRIGTAIHGGALLRSLSVMENIMLPIYELPNGDNDDHADWIERLIDRLGLRKLTEMPVSALSRGEGQRVGLARALVLRPEILICDDVFSGLDWRTRDGIVGFFEELREALNLTIVVCTASPEIAMRAANRLLILEHGDCIATGTPSEIRDMEDPVVRKVFLSHIEAMQRFGNVSGASGEAGRP